MKKRVKLLCIFTIIVIAMSSIFLTGCLNPYKIYYWQVKNVRWYSSEVQMELFVLNTVGENEILGSLIINDEKINIVARMDYTTELDIFIYPNNMPDDDYCAMVCNYKISKDKKTLTLEVLEDKLLGNKYSVIVLTASEIALEDFAPTEILNTTWKSTIPEINIDINEYDGNQGYLVKDSVQIPIDFQWTENDTFKIFRIIDGVAEDEEIISGSYTGNANEAQLIIEKDLIWNNEYQTITISTAA